MAGGESAERRVSQDQIVTGVPDMVNVKELSTPELLSRIAELQQIQKTHSTRTPAWQTASELLAPCFAEMAIREPA
jgi:hypothetical protein